MMLRPGWFVVAGVIAAPSVVDACGGCFHPTNAGAMTAQVVTDHRMALSLSESQTVLWDQIRYAGSPDEFVWVLPVPDGTQAGVQLADNAFINALDSYTAPIITATLPFCFGGASTGGGGVGCGGGFGYGASSAAPTSAMDMQENTAQGIQEVVGPYAVNIIGPHIGGGSLTTWLTGHGFDVPSGVSPVVDYYATMQSDYVILRLRPGEGVQAMQPVRVTLPGYVPTLPLRMITAGVEDKVDISLMVIANSQVAAGGFANPPLSDAPLTFDYVTQTSNYPQAFSALAASYPHGAWVTETVQTIVPTVSYVPTMMPTVADAGTEDAVETDAGTDAGTDAATLDGSQDAAGDDASDAAAAEDGANDGASSPADAATGVFDPYADLHAAFFGLPGGGVVTRMRAELTVSQLNQDLVLNASVTMSTLGRTVVAPTLLHGPVCPTNTSSTAGADGCGCATIDRHQGRDSGVALFLAAFGTLIGRRLVRRGRGRSPSPHA